LINLCTLDTVAVAGNVLF